MIQLTGTDLNNQSLKPHKIELSYITYVNGVDAVTSLDIKLNLIFLGFDIIIEIAHLINEFFITIDEVKMC